MFNKIGKVIAIFSKYFSIAAFGAIMAAFFEYGYHGFILFGLVVDIVLFTASIIAINIIKKEMEA